MTPDTTVDDAIAEFCLVFEIPAGKEFRNSLNRFWLDKFIAKGITGVQVKEATQHLLDTFNEKHYKPQLRHLFKMAEKCRGSLSIGERETTLCDICDEYGYVLVRGYLRGFDEPYWAFRLCTCPNAADAYPKVNTWKDEGLPRRRVFSPNEQFAWCVMRDDEKARAQAAEWREMRWEEKEARPVADVIDGSIPF